MRSILVLMSILPYLTTCQNWATSHRSYFELEPTTSGQVSQGLNRGPADFSDEEITAIVARHNKYRRETRPEGANLRHMRWDGLLATMAQTRANYCNFEHGGLEPNISPFESIGQNLYVASEGSVDAESGVVATDRWYSDEQFYDYNYDSCSDVCGHYKQIVWATTYTIGCGRRRCGRVSNVFFSDPAYIIVCNYGPAGNFHGEKPFIPGPRCSDCGKEAGFCYDNLCIDCSGPNHFSGCHCKLECLNCGTLDEDTCTCSCAPGWDGTDCSKPCVNNHEWCNASPGWPGPDFCDFSPDVPRLCRQMCSVCDAPDPKLKCNCGDTTVDCVAWAVSGYCEESQWVQTNCKKSCNTCPPSAAANSCTDSNTDCPYWARIGECDGNTDWMHINCPVSCDVCSPPVTEMPCTDGNADCPYWTDIGECDANADWMLMNCQLSCGVCQPESQGVDGESETDQGKTGDQEVPEPVGTKVPCVDSNTDCPYWARIGECDVNSDWMLINCQLSCDVCQPEPKKDLYDEDETDGTDQRETGVGTVGEGVTENQVPEPATTKIPCVERNTDCPNWAKIGECDVNADWMLTYCQLSCGVCQAEPEKSVDDAEETDGIDQQTGAGTDDEVVTEYQTPGPSAETTEAPCLDSEIDCPHWASIGQCDINPEYMLSYCQLSCDVCQPNSEEVVHGEDETTGSDQGETDTETGVEGVNEHQPSEPPALEFPCVDSNTDCPDWARIGECDVNPDWMLINCQLSCEVCQLEPNKGVDIEVETDVTDGIVQGETGAGHGYEEVSEHPTPEPEHTEYAMNGEGETGQGITDTGNLNEGVGDHQVPGPATTGVSCIDGNINCPDWARGGGCDVNPDWMLINCQLSCGVCQPDAEKGVDDEGETDEIDQGETDEIDQGKTGTGTGDERNTEPQTPEPENDVNHEGEIGGTDEGKTDAGTGGEVNTDHKVPEPATTEVPCKDGNIDCPDWARIGGCNENPAWMLVNCQLSCGVCQLEPGKAVDNGEETRRTDREEINAGTDGDDVTVRTVVEIESLGISAVGGNEGRGEGESRRTDSDIGQTGSAGGSQDGGADIVKNVGDSEAGNTPAYCNAVFTAITTINGELYCFESSRLWRFDRVRKGRLLSPVEGEPTKKTFPKISSKVKAVYQTSGRKVVLVKGDTIWLTSYQSVKDAWIADYGYPQKIKSYGRGLPINPTCAFYSIFENKSYFFKGAYVWRFDEYFKTVDLTKAKTRVLFKGIPKKPSGALQDENGDTLIVSGEEFYRIPVRSKAAVGEPSNFASEFLIDC